MRIRPLVLFLCIPAAVFAQSGVNTGDTAWVLISSALVMFMTVPALAFFYGGLVKRKNILNVLMQCFVSLAAISLLWVIVGYALAFGPDELIPGVLGGLSWAFLKGVSVVPSELYATTVPHLAFMIFQGMFAVITPALIIGAFAERMKFSTFLLFSVLWTLLIYCPVAHWMWATNGWLSKLGAVDFAGGIVVHINAGVAALVTAIIIGKRNYLKPTPPHNLAFTMLGAAMLWFGWFGFNAGSALSANGIAANAFVVTNTSAAAATMVWLVLDWLLVKRPTTLGSATGAIAGLAAITPAAGFVDMPAAIIIGSVASALCYIMVVYVKPKFGYDDALDAFGVHGIGGIWGTIAVGLFANPEVQANYTGLVFGSTKLFSAQIIAAAVVTAYAFIVTFVLYKVLDLILHVRVNEKEEAMGLDITQHNERGYTVVE
ncbi:MAG: ammonium transporter [Spirochaetota bacterium]